ncbi:MAG: Gfo/Idh/MocA family oxidoreductase, partial [Rhizobiaceae bacterium]
MTTDLRRSWPPPSSPKPIVVIGAGGIVRDAHLPAYRKADFKVCAIHDIDSDKATRMAGDWDIPAVFKTLEDAVDANGTNAVYDLALPPDAIAGTLKHLEAGSAVLIQKPMGADLDGARAIR